MTNKDLHFCPVQYRSVFNSSIQEQHDEVQYDISKKYIPRMMWQIVTSFFLSVQSAVCTVQYYSHQKLFTKNQEYPHQMYSTVQYNKI